MNYMSSKISSFRNIIWNIESAESSSPKVKVVKNTILSNPQKIWESIRESESEFMELKPGLWFDFNSGKRCSGFPCARSIASFLSSHRGILCVGVNVDKSLKGLVSNFSPFPADKDPYDSFQLEFQQMIYSFARQRRSNTADDNLPSTETHLGENYPDLSG